MSMRDYLNLGLHRGLEACITTGEWNPNTFKTFAANLSGDAVVMDDGSVVIYDYPTTKTTIESLAWEMREQCEKLGVEITYKNKLCVVRKCEATKN